MDKALSKSIWHEFLEVVRKADNMEQLDIIGDVFLSCEERADVVKRFVVVKELLKGELTQREIAKKYDVSIAKITRGSNALKTYNQEKIDALKRIYD